MTRAFEDPRKIDMRERCRIAIDAAGHDLVDAPVNVPPPAEAAIQGSIRGDLQSLDGDLARYCYYLRPTGRGALPQWIASIATASQALNGCVVYVVVDEADPALIESCEKAGAGLLRLTEESTFDWIVDPSGWSPDAEREQFLQRVRTLRRTLDTKLGLNINSLQANYAKARELTAGLSPAKRDEYVSGLESSVEDWRRWGDEMSSALDAAASREDPEELDVVARRIASGLIADDEDGEV